MENQNINLQELEELRSQVAEFKNRIEKQELVNRRMLTVAMNGHVSWIKQMNTWTYYIILALTPLIIAILRIASCSWVLILFFVALLIGEAIFNIWNVKTISDKHLATHDVLSVQQRLISYKRREKFQLFIESPIILFWFVWLFYDISPYKLIPAVVGAVIGLFITSFVYIREMISLNKAINEIDIFKKEENI